MDEDLDRMYRASESASYASIDEFYASVNAYNRTFQQGAIFNEYMNQQRRHGRGVVYEGENGVFSESWFVVCRSDEVKRGDVIARGFLDGQVAVFRGENGEASVVSAYCPHLGAHLASGRVVGNEIECAFHRWTFAQDGMCQRTGCGDPVPRGARVFKYPTAERFGLIFAFNGESAWWPLPDMGAPDDELVFHPEILHVDINNDPWVTMANTFDWNHFEAVHGLKYDIDDDTVIWSDHAARFHIDADVPGPEKLRFRYDVGIWGTSIFLQHGDLGGNWFAYMAPCGVPRPGVSRVYFVIATRKGDGSEAGERAARECLKLGLDMEKLIVSQDVPILNFARFSRGLMTKKDRMLVRFLEHVRKFPRAHPGADHIR
jgi:nitrite reductase/ring-hydroxylating ferredoxin subunit